LATRKLIEVMVLQQQHESPRS